MDHDFIGGPCDRIACEADTGSPRIDHLLHDDRHPAIGSNQPQLAAIGRRSLAECAGPHLPDCRPQPVSPTNIQHALVDAGKRMVCAVLADGRRANRDGRSIRDASRMDFPDRGFQLFVDNSVFNSLPTCCRIFGSCAV